MMGEEYAGAVGRIRYFWRFQCVKLRLMMEIVGLISMFAFGIVGIFAAIYQWYIPSHIMKFSYNTYGEAFTEYIWALIALPCALYTLKVNFWRLAEKW